MLDDEKIFIARRFINVLLRACTLGAKFLLIFLLAKFLEPSEVAIYGLFTATISYLLMAVGFEFHNFSIRELLAVSQCKWASMLRDQIVFYSLIYIIFLPIFLVIFIYELLPWRTVFWFFPLLVLEHMAMEINRLLITMSKPLWASIILFFRSGLWGILVGVLFWTDQVPRNLNSVFLAWFLGVVSACFFGGYAIQRVTINSVFEKINWSWIKRGAIASIPFLIATLSFRALYVSDRYLIEAIGGIEVLAAYVVFVGIGNAIWSFLDASLFSYSLPLIISASNKEDKSEFNSKIRLLNKQTFWCVFILSISAAILAKPFIAWIGKQIYLENFSLLYWIIAAMSVYALSTASHFGLYALKKDKTITAVQIITLVVFIGSVFFLSSKWKVISVPISLLLCFLVGLFLKYTFLWRYSFRQQRNINLF